jgi:hypothetical protein
MPFGSIGGRETTPTPEDLAAQIALIQAQLAGGGGNGRTSSTTTERSSSTSSNVNIYSLNQVRNVATSAFESALGRAPSQQELNTFLTSLNAYSKANPEKNTRTASGTTTSTDTSESNKTGTKTTKTSSPVSSSTSSTTSSGGVDVAGFAAEQLENTTEARAVKVDDIFRGAMGFLANQIGG